MTSIGELEKSRAQHFDVFEGISNTITSAKADITSLTWPNQLHTFHNKYLHSP